METKDRAHIEKIIRDRRLAHEELLSSGSKTYRAFLDMEKAAYAEGRLDKRSKELIALGISIVINCESCMQWHLGEAQKAGAAREQVLEAVDVAVEMGGGPATVAARFALKALEYHFGPSEPTERAAAREGRGKMQIREAGELRAGDVGRIVELHGVLYAQECGFDSTFEAYVAEPLARFVRTRGPRERLWLVEEDGSLMGCLAIVRVNDEEAQLRWFLLHPTLRGRGLGRGLLEQAVAFCRECSYHRIMLWTVSELQAAGQLYQQAGFRLVEERAAQLWGRPVNEQRYLLELP